MTTIPDDTRTVIQSAADELTSQAGARFAAFGPHDPLGGRLWSIACHLKEDVLAPSQVAAEQAEGDVREALAEVILAEHEPGFANVQSSKARDALLQQFRQVADAVLSSGLVVPVGEVEWLRSALAPVVEYVNVERNYTTMFGDHHANDVQLVMRDLRLAQAEEKRLRAELAQVTQWHDEVRQECAELRRVLAGIGDGTNEGDQG